MDEKEKISPFKPVVTVIAVVAATVIVSGVGVNWYIENYLKPQMITEVQAVRGDANSDAWVNKDFNAAITKLTAAVETAEAAGAKSESKVKLDLASVYLRDRQADAMPIYVEIFYGDKYPLNHRAQALSDAMWHVSSHIGDGSLDAAFAREHVFGPGKFDILPAGFPLANNEDVIKATIIGFKKAFETHPSHVSAIAAARYSDVLLPKDRGTWNADMPTVQEMDRLLREGEALLEQARQVSEAENQFYTDVQYAYYTRATAMQYLAMAGARSAAEFSDAIDDTIAYADRFSSEQRYHAAIFKALSGFRYACGIATLERPLIRERESRIKSLLENLYNLPKDDLARRWAIKAIADKPENECHEPTVYIAKNVDTRLKDVLVNEIGGWTARHFE